MKKNLVLIIKFILCLGIALQLTMLLSGLGAFDFIAMNLRVYPHVLLFILLGFGGFYLVWRKNVWVSILTVTNVLLFIINFKIAYPERPFF